MRPTRSKTSRMRTRPLRPTAEHVGRQFRETSYLEQVREEPEQSTQSRPQPHFCGLVCPQFAPSHGRADDSDDAAAGVRRKLYRCGVDPMRPRRHIEAKTPRRSGRMTGQQDVGPVATDAGRNIGLERARSTSYPRSGPPCTIALSMREPARPFDDRDLMHVRRCLRIAFAANHRDSTRSILERGPFRRRVHYHLRSRRTPSTCSS